MIYVIVSGEYSDFKVRGVVETAVPVTNWPYIESKVIEYFNANVDVDEWSFDDDQLQKALEYAGFVLPDYELKQLDLHRTFGEEPDRWEIDT